MGLPPSKTSSSSSSLPAKRLGMTRDDSRQSSKSSRRRHLQRIRGYLPARDFPALVAAAPKGLFLVGPPSSSSTATLGPEQPFCFVDQHHPRDADRLVHRHLPAHRRRLAPQDPPMTFMRRVRTGTRSAHDPRRPASRVPDMELDEYRVGLDAWLADDADLRPEHENAPLDDESLSWRRSSASPSTPAGCGGAGPSTSAGSAAPPCSARISPRR